MRYNVQTLPDFEREAKPLLKKYPSLKKELIVLTGILEETPATGISLGKNCYKIRIAIESKGKGKAGGGRIITCFAMEKDTVYLISIYDKSEHENIDAQQLESLVKSIKT